MASAHINSKDLLKTITENKEDMDNVQRSLEKLRLLTSDEQTENGTLRSRIEEQSSLICILKQRSNEMLLRCQALQKVTAELECLVTEGQKELHLERKKSTMLEKRFVELASNHQRMIVFKDEYKMQNAQLVEENRLLRKENDTRFSQKLHDKERLIHQLTQEIKLIEDKHKTIEKDYKEKEDGLQSKLLKQKALFESKEASLLNKLHDVQHNLKCAEDIYNDFKHQLQKAGDDHDFKEKEMEKTIKTLSVEKDKFFHLSFERGKVIQENQEKIHQLETKLEEEEKDKAKADNRFKQEAEAVNANLKVKNLQSALDETMKKYAKVKEDYEAYQEHSRNLLSQEKELNAKLRYMIG